MAGAMAFFGQHIPLRYKIESLKREEIPALPEMAMREALLNAVFIVTTLNGVAPLWSQSSEIE